MQGHCSLHALSPPPPGLVMCSRLWMGSVKLPSCVPTTGPASRGKASLFSELQKAFARRPAGRRLLPPAAHELRESAGPRPAGEAPGCRAPGHGQRANAEAGAPGRSASTGAGLRLLHRTPEGGGLRLWAERRKERGTPPPTASHPTRRLAVIDAGSATGASLLKTCCQPCFSEP